MLTYLLTVFVVAIAQLPVRHGVKVSNPDLFR